MATNSDKRIEPIQLFARVFIRGSIFALTGLHIGGSGGGFNIGGNDNPVLVNPLSGEPYIPGSSLKGKMRSLTEKYLGLELKSHANVMMHTAESQTEYNKSPVAKIYGVPAPSNANDKTFLPYPTRLIVRDVPLSQRSKDALKAARVDQYTEVKTEVSIDRITSAANPRSMERVPAGVIFDPMELVYNVYGENDLDLLLTVINGMALLEDDYLGGSGSRGSGQIEFRDLAVSFKHAHTDPESHTVKYADGSDVPATYGSMGNLYESCNLLISDLRNLIFGQ